MTNESNDPTEPVEVQHYGPAPQAAPSATGSWQAAPAWSSRPPLATPTRPAPAPRLGTAGLVGLALVAGIVSGALSAVAVTNLAPAEQAAQQGTDGGTSNTISNVPIDESSAVLAAVVKVMPATVKIESTINGVLGSEQGTGSGFIFDPDGWILTNGHVVQDADQIMVTLNDGRAFDGEVYGIDTLTDLAIIQIDATGLPAAPLGSSAALEPGQLAIAIGNPLGTYDNTVTTGVVSGLGRQIQANDASQQTAETLNNLLQTDAAINPGNSGGPLINSVGQVIGVNTAVNADAQGIGFAIPIDVAKPILEQAVNGEELVRPWIGVYYSLVTHAVAEQDGLPSDYGALIGSASGDAVFPGSPAEEAGLQPGDIIVAVDGTRVDEDNDLSTLILPKAPGDTVTLRILRGNTTTDVDVTLGTLPAQR
jgi:S1-C subfamily serine protease